MSKMNVSINIAKARWPSSIKYKNLSNIPRNIFWKKEMDIKMNWNVISAALRGNVVLRDRIDAKIDNDRLNCFDNTDIRKIYFQAFPRPSRQRNYKGKFKKSIIGYRYFFFTYHGQDMPSLMDIPHLHAYYLGKCIQQNVHWHGIVFTTLHYRQTFIFERIIAKQKRKLDVQAVYKDTKKVIGYIAGQTPQGKLYKRKTNVYGNWDRDLNTLVSIEPQHEGSSNPLISCDVGDLPAYGLYNASLESIRNAINGNRWRFNKRFHVQFKDKSDMEKYVKFITKFIYTKLDIFITGKEFDFKKYNNEPILVIDSILFSQHDILSIPFEDFSRRNNIFLVFSYDNIDIRNFQKLSFSERSKFIDESISPKKSFKEIQ
jgi:hypothetical protein